MARCVFLLLALGVARTAAQSAVVSPEEAIRAVVSERLGVAAIVTVADLETAVTAETGLVAEPEVAARLGQPSRFALEVGGNRRGLAVATVTVRARHPRAARVIARDEIIGIDAVRFIDGELTAMRIEALLGDGEVPGLEARRSIAEGEPLTPAVVRVPPLVKSGDQVDVIVRVGAVQVTGTGVANGSGRAGDTIRVRTPQRSRMLTGRIVGPGLVEIEP